VTNPGVRPAAPRLTHLLAQVALATSAMIIVNGCSTTSPAPPASVVTDACSLLTEKQIEDATRLDVRPDAVRVTARPSPAGAKRSVCAWTDRHGEGMVELVVYPSGGRKVMTERRRALRTDDKVRAPVPVAVPGADRAFRIPSLGLLGMRLRDSYVQVRLIGGQVRPGDERRLATVVMRAWQRHARPAS
jgi:hypothetical protein